MSNKSLKDKLINTLQGMEDRFPGLGDKVGEKDILFKENAKSKTKFRQ